MSFHEGSNWQAKKEDKKEPLYKTEAEKPGKDETFLSDLFHKYKVFQRNEDFEDHYSMISEILNHFKPAKP